MKPPIGCVLFDLDGVLADYDRGVRVATLARHLDRSAEAVHAAIYASGIEDAADAGRLDTPAYLSALGRELDCRVDADAWVDARRSATHVRQPMLALAGALRERGITVAVLSNNGSLMAERWPAIAPALFPLFEGRAFCSARLGAAKPVPAAYLRCLQTLAMLPATTLFVDDNAANIDGAREAGLAGHRFVDRPTLVGALAGFGLD
ncbi:MAG: HAD family phosphatase [Frateuria sp.]|uniref:HAD family hydrolase n=1 Tax=Frateuria sp. TaxID=2211372 RepID=UPI00179F7E76|nr:HAD family phosphatase [Frateuria sp.]NUO71953.1 HAD family phosphatase [Frateuria sp.]NUR23677.1 HAD family phosphatase [Frateuria sp.]